MQEHICKLMHCLRDYIEGNEKKKLEQAINSLKEEFNFEPIAVNQIQLALFLFRDAVNNVLRSHNIKPHWMFALDSLMSTAIQAAMGILSPDPIRETREGGGSDGIGSTSGISTVNSTKSHKVLEYTAASKLHSDYQEQFEQFRTENERLLHELLESQKSYQLLLKSSLDEQKLHLQLLHQTTQQMRVFGQILTITTPSSVLRSSEAGYGSHQTVSEDDLSSQVGGAVDLISDPSVVGANELAIAGEAAAAGGTACCHHRHDSNLAGSSSGIGSSSTIGQHQQMSVQQLPLNIRDPKLVEFLTELHLDRISIEKVIKIAANFKNTSIHASFFSACSFFKKNTRMMTSCTISAEMI